LIDDAKNVTQSPLVSVHVIDCLKPEHGGPSYSVPALAQALGRHHVNVKLRTVASEDSPLPYSANFSHSVHSLSPLGTIARASRDLRCALVRDAGAGAILHSHGLWLMPNVYPAWAKKESRGAAKLVHSIRGMLSPAALSMAAWKKRPFWLLWQQAALRAADCLHATAASECEEIRRAGLRNPVAVIPNGVDLPVLKPRDAGIGGERIVLSIGRLHQKKGLDRLVRAWSAVEADFPDWRLRIVGPAERGYDAKLRQLAGELGAQRIAVEGPVFADDKLTAYRSADLFVLPSLNENFGLTAAEALASELPVISTRGAPWQGLNAHRCGWWIDHGVEPLADTLRKAMSMSSEERRTMGARGRVWVAEAFSWDKIARDFRDVYRWLRFGGEAPPTVTFD
jgi:glycosyltransferase involved in cell wall biosynthesis